jgi:hypothetical protein
MDRFDDEARRVFAEAWRASNRADEPAPHPVLMEHFAAALRGAYADGARPCVDIFDDFDETEIRSETTSVREAWATGRDIRDRLAPTAPKPDARGRCGTCDGTGIEFGGDPCRFCDGSGSAHANPAAPPNPVSQPDAGGRGAFCSGFGEVPDGPHDGTFGSMMDCPACTEPNHVSQPPAQPNGEGDALGRPETYRAGTVPEKVDPSRCGYCGHPKNSGSCQRSHP